MSKMDNEKLDHLILETWTDFIDLKNKAELSEVLIPNSMPLLWFGDLAKYEKLLTEFSSVNLETYKSNLNRYFEYNPSPWFNQLAKFLPVFDSAYKESENQINRALHIDLFTPIATHPVWPGLAKSQQEQFKMKFPQLLQLLEPDVLLTSLSVSNLKILLKNAGTEIEEIFDKEEVGKAAKYVRAYRVDKKLIVINGRNFQGTYFGGMTDQFVRKCLTEIKGMI